MGLLAPQLLPQLGILRFEVGQPPDVRAIGRADEVRKHVHFAEHLPDEIVGCLRVCQSRPVGTRDLAACQRLAP